MGILRRRTFLRWLGAVPVAAAVPFLRWPVWSGAQVPADRLDPWIELRLDHLAGNLNQIRKRVKGRPVLAVIKANAYGHGLIEIGRFLERQQIAGLAVGKVDEALRLRAAGVRVPVLNFGPYTAEQARELVRWNVAQSVFTRRFRDLVQAARSLQKPARVHVNIDTGLGRVGVPHDRALAFLEELARYPEIRIEGVFTTLTEDPEFDRIQLQRFHDVCEGARNRGIDVGRRHAASSAAVLDEPRAWLDMVRPGITLYGLYPSERAARERRLDLKPVLALKTRVVYVKTLRPGDSVSYHRAFIARQPTTVATLPIGYSDGIPWTVEDRAWVLIRGQRCRLVAPPTANHMVVDVSHVAGVTAGDEAVLIGRQGKATLTAHDWAQWAGTSAYKIVIGLSPLLPRTAVSASAG